MRVLVYGGRRNADSRLAWTALDYLLAIGFITFEIDGEADGYDSLAGSWALSRGVPRQGYPILPEERALYGSRSGNHRNQRMLTDSRPEAAVEFPGGTGTLDMRERLLAHGIQPLQVPRRPKQ